VNHNRQRLSTMTLLPIPIVPAPNTTEKRIISPDMKAPDKSLTKPKRRIAALAYKLWQDRCCQKDHRKKIGFGPQKNCAWGGEPAAGTLHFLTVAAMSTIASSH
jgi:hypothetical protein